MAQTAFTDGGTFSDGGLWSEGHALFWGQELHLGSELAGEPPSGMKTALRLAHWLVEHGRQVEPDVIAGPEGGRLRLEPSADYRFVKVGKLQS